MDTLEDILQAVAEDLDASVPYADILRRKGYRTPKAILRAGSADRLSSICGLLPGDADAIWEAAKGTTGLSVKQLLRAPLPDLKLSGSSRCSSDAEPDRKTHPTNVLHWEGWKQEVRERVDAATSRYQDKRYKEQESSGIVIRSESGAVNGICSNACSRINKLSMDNDLGFTFSTHPSRRKSDSQMVAMAAPGFVAEPPEEVLQFDFPDICAVQDSGGSRQTAQTTEVKSQFRVQGVEGLSLPEVWKAWVNGNRTYGGLKAGVAKNAVNVIAQELGYMSRRGHTTGIISTYYNTWLLKTDRKGTLWVTDAIPFDATGTDTEPSVTEVFLYSLVMNLRQWDSTPYPTAKAPGEQPVSAAAFGVERSQAHAELAQQNSRSEEPEVESGCTRSGHPYLSSRKLHLSSVLTSTVVQGTVAAIRLATNGSDVQGAKQEVAVYKRLERLQGKCVPRLLAYGSIYDCKAYFVATEYIQGTAWSWGLPLHRALDSQLQAAINSIHALGVRHADLHEDNILVTRDHRVLILDFASAELDPSQESLAAEQASINDMLSWQAPVHCPASGAPRKKSSLGSFDARGLLLAALP